MRDTFIDKFAAVPVARRRLGQLAWLLVLCCVAFMTAAPVGWAQSGPAHPEFPTSRVLAYVSAQKGEKAHVVFVPPLRNFKRAQTFRLKTPRGVVTVTCGIPRLANPPETASTDMSVPLEESVFTFRAPASLPIFLPFPYNGYGGEALHEARLNGKVAERGSLNGKIVSRNRHKGDRVYWETAPIVFTGARNKLALILFNSGGE